ncbi:hypothetical protein F4782DRAFT_170857 [Xylaria castorea]|nr:hypothetical protein F4782DRAFT_170857 [Xylaria castorea]
MSMSSDKDITLLGTSLGSSEGGSSSNVKLNKEVLASQAQFPKDAPNASLRSKVGDTENDKSQAKSKDNQGNLDEEKAVTVGNSRAGLQKCPNRSIEDNLSDDDIRSPGQFLSTLGQESIGNSIITLRNTLPERRAKASRRILQAKAYAELVEDRILDLEQKVRDLNNEKDSLAEDNSSPGGIPPIIRLAPMGWTDFNHRTFINRKDFTGTWKHRPEIDELSRPVIEILIEEPYYGFGLSRSGKQSSDDSLSHLSAPGLSTFQPDDFSVEPYQIRVRSKLLLKTLKEITGTNVTIGPHEHRLLLLRPFKLLVYFEQDIRSSLQKMELANSNYDRDVNQNRAANEKSPEPMAGQRPTTNIPFPVQETHSLSALKELRLLCTLIDDCLSRPVQLQRGIGPNITKVTFSELWYIFKPGYEVRTPGESQMQLYRIAKVTGGRGIFKGQTDAPLPEDLASTKLKEEGFSEGSFIIECFYIHYDGTRFGPVNKTFQIRRFDGERNITMLPVAPLHCYANEGEIRKRLETRGKKFTELSNPAARAHRKYKGLTLDKNPEQVESEVIIDFELAFIQTKIEKPALGLRDKLVADDRRELASLPATDSICDLSGCCGNDIMFGDYQIDAMERDHFMEKHKSLIDDSPESSDELSLEHIILLPPHVYGFVLRTRRWATFDIDRLEEIPPNDEGWNNLVIKKYIKDTVLALVKNHERPRGSQAMIQGALSSVDLVQGKGRGLIILLHGEPGVGKTSTAECVAALTGRPLFPITCGDIGDKAETVETNLEKNFQLAHKWGCVLLLDEADIFLSARTVDDIQRNAIVSVFLRTLEYYSGILFLTTNRVGKIDRAFKSRIHFSLLYKKLNRERTIRIWKNNLRRVQHEFKIEGREINCKGNEILEFAKKHYKELKESDDLIVWNGRQIRNAFQTAIAIAAYNASQHSGAGGGVIPILDASQFEMVARSAKQFDKYLKKASLNTDAEMARIAAEREDDYASSSEDDTKRPKERFKKNSRKTSKKRKNSRRNGSDEDSDEDSEKSSDEELEESSNWDSEDTGEEDKRPTKKSKKG